MSTTTLGIILLVGLLLAALIYEWRSYQLGLESLRSWPKAELRYYIQELVDDTATAINPEQREHLVRTCIDVYRKAHDDGWLPETKPFSGGTL